ARTGWELDTLVSALMTALPDHAASPLMTRLQDELRTESVRSQAREQFTGAVDRIFDTAESVCIASVARTVLRAVRDSVVSVARAAYFHERRSLNNFHRDRVITFEQIAE
ncbi:hypothetical protein ACRW5K_26320, partial [Escherichia coli]